MLAKPRSILMMLFLLIALVLASCSGGAPLPGTEAEQEEEAAAPAQEEEAAEEEAVEEEAEPAEEEVAEEEAEEETAAETSAEEETEAMDGELNMVLLPKFLGILVFDQANEGAMEANAELGNPANLEFLGPTPENSVAGQIEIVTTAATQGVDAIMISNNAGDQIAPAAQAAIDSGATVVTWDSPIPSAEGEQVFIAQVDFDETGQVMADMALSIMGDEGGEFAVLSASPDAANQNAWIAAMEEALTDSKYDTLELVDIVYGNDQSEDSYNQALALVDKYPDLKLIMAPTTVGIAAAAKAMQDEGLCDQVKVSGLGLPAEMVSYTLNGCAPEFALWSFVDLGYLTFYTSYLLATGEIEAAEGTTFEAGRMGSYTIEKDPTRDEGLRVLMGPFTVYDETNVADAAGGEMAATDDGGGDVVVAEPGQDMNAILLPKFLGILVFDQANEGAVEAAGELQAGGDLEFLGPTPENSVAGQIEIVTTGTTQGVDAIMISNNAGDQIAPAAQAAVDSGATVVTWDSPIPSAEGEQVFIAQVDFDETGQVMADMALSIIGDEGGEFAVLSASPDAANQNAWIAAMEEALTDSKYDALELVDIVYGNDQSEDSYNQALALVDKYPDLKLIMAPTTVGIAAAAKAMQDEGLCDEVKVSGLGLPAEMVSYTLNGCAPEFALWSFVDLGYLTYYTTYLIATGQMEAAEGVTFEAGRMGTYTIEKDPTRDEGLRVLMGPFTVYDETNVEAAAGGAEVASTDSGGGDVVVAEPGQEMNAILLPKFLGILVFDQANEGAEEAAGELQAGGDLEFLGPTPENSVAGQIEIVTTGTTQGVDAIMISNNAGDQIAPAAQAAVDSGATVVTWDSPIPSAEGEQVFIAQVDFDETGQVMADMALSIMGDEGGEFAVLSASPDAANQNAWIAAMEEALTDSKYDALELVDIVYGNDQSEDSYNQALALVDKYPDLKLIMAPTTVGIAAAAKAMQDEGLCDEVKVSGLGLPAEMVSYTLNGCAPEFALWSFVDLGYLTYYTTYLIATGQMEAAEGVTFEAGRMGTYTIEKDPTRDEGLRVLMGPFTVYDETNVEAAAGGAEVGSADGGVVVPEPGLDMNAILLPKFLGILVFDQANEGAQEAAGELEAGGDLEFLGPTPENSVAGQIEIVTTGTTQGVDAIMISNNAGDQIAPAAQAAIDSGATIVTWDSPIPSAEGEQVFIAQVDFDETGQVMADMALSIMGDEGGEFAVLSASPDAANQNAWIAAMEEALADSKYDALELVDIVYGNDQSEDSYNQALALVDKYPDLKLIMAPTTVGIAAAAKAMQDEGLCDEVKVSGLGLPAEMESYTLNGCAPEFALWSFVDLGYLTYYTTYLIATGQMEAAEGVTFEAGRMGTYTIEKDPTRDEGLRVLMGPFTVYDETNVSQ